MAKARNQPSSIDGLPDFVVERVNQRRTKEGWSIDQLVEYCADEGYEISRSAMGRHVRSLYLDVEGAAERLMRSNAIGTALVERLGDKPDNELARLNIQLMQSQIFDMIMREEREDEEGNPLPGDALKLGRLSQAIQRLLSAEKMNVERVRVIEKAAAEKATAAAAEKAVTAARSKGLSSQTVEAIRFAVLGSDE